MTDPQYATIYTDGSCLNNPGPGGWAAIVLTDGDPILLTGGESKTTNNRMELTAAIKGLEVILTGGSVVVHSDSEYLIKTMTKGWKRNANHDLWKRLDALSAARAVDWQWVRGHAGDHWNEEADRLAVEAMKIAAGGGDSDGTSTPTLTHLNSRGQAQMVDVSEKPDSQRTAMAQAVVVMRPETLDMILQGQMVKGDVFTVARIAGISAAKRTDELIPLAHPLPLNHVGVEFHPDPAKGMVTITAIAGTVAKTGVEMEALVAASISALTIYDMCKAVDRGMRVRDVWLLEKRGGQHGDYRAP